MHILEHFKQVIDQGTAAHPWIQALIIVLVAVLAATLARFLFGRVLIRLTARTSTTLDDRVLAVMRKPVFLSVLLVGLWGASAVLEPPEQVSSYFGVSIKTLVILLWAIAINSIVTLVLAVTVASEKSRIIQVRSRPIFELMSKVIVVGGAGYMLLLTWGVDPTGWIASAGVVGVAVGFAAKDTVANLISGVFIMADAPYKIGDYVVLGTGERGKVTDIGIRSTRILTRDDLEIIVPNAVIAGAKIVNETGGPYEMRRVRCTIDVAYGSDVDQVRKVLDEAARACDQLVADPEPRIRLREFAPSGLRFQLMGWVKEPELRGRAEDSLNTAVYNGLNDAGIEIPYSKHDVYIKQAPRDMLSLLEEED